MRIGSKYESETARKRKEASEGGETAGGIETDRRRQRKKTEPQIFWWCYRYMVHGGRAADLF